MFGENDGLGFNWMPRQLPDEEMSTAELQLKEHTKNVGGFQKDEGKPITVQDEKTVLPTSEDDYFIRQLRRIP